MPSITKNKIGYKVKRKKASKKRRDLKNLGRKSKKLKKDVEQPAGMFQKIEIQDPKLRETITALGDPALAKRVLALQEDNPRGTLPELVAMDWLNSRHHQYFYQVQVLGGRRAGGLVPDFVLPQGGGALALLVNGVYWHSGFEQKAHDNTARARLLGTTAFGYRIDNVVEVWDSKLFDSPDSTMNAAIAGIGFGP